MRLQGIMTEESTTNHTRPEEQELKITTIEQVKTILERLVELMESDNKEKPVDETNTEDQSEDKLEDEKEDEKNESEKSEFSADLEVVSKSNEQMIAYSIAYPAMPMGWKDTQNDWVSAEEIQKMAHNWMINSGNYDIQHRILNVSKSDASVVESFIAPVDFMWPTGNDSFKRITKGSWIVATKFSPNLWEKVKSGEINAYSIRGKAKRTKIS